MHYVIYFNPIIIVIYYYFFYHHLRNILSFLIGIIWKYHKGNIFVDEKEIDKLWRHLWNVLEIKWFVWISCLKTSLKEILFFFFKVFFHAYSSRVKYSTRKMYLKYYLRGKIKKAKKHFWNWIEFCSRTFPKYFSLIFKSAYVQ